MVVVLVLVLVLVMVMVMHCDGDGVGVCVCVGVGAGVGDGDVMWFVCLWRRLSVRRCFGEKRGSQTYHYTPRNRQAAKTIANTHVSQT